MTTLQTLNVNNILRLLLFSSPQSVFFRKMTGYGAVLGLLGAVLGADKFNQTPNWGL